jgi:hypothetical protein
MVRIDRKMKKRSESIGSWLRTLVAWRRPVRASATASAAEQVERADDSDPLSRLRRKLRSGGGALALWRIPLGDVVGASVTEGVWV